MRTLDSIIAQITSPAMLDDLANVLRANESDFPEIEAECHRALGTLRTTRSQELTPTVDAYITACQTEVIANILYAAYLGYRANLNNFHAPFSTQFERLDFTDYIRDHLMGHFPVCYKANAIKEAFIKTVPDEQQELIDTIQTYYIDLDVAGPKLAHYAGYVISNKLLPWLEPGYQVDYAQTYRYTHEVQKYMGYLPL